MQGRTFQILLITGAAALSVALYFAPRNPPPGKQMHAAKPEADQKFNFNDLLAYQQKGLSPEESQKSESWLKELEQSASRVNLNLYDSVARIWDQKKMFALSAHYYELKAGKDHLEKSFLNASYRYFDAYKDAVDSTVKMNLAEKAILNYSKVLELNSKNLDAKTDLGILYAEATPEPMKGIMMLRDVVAENPDHENAQLNLGFLSLKSNQFDKALERFDKVLVINPEHIDAHLFKGQVYVQKGDKQKAIENFEKFNTLSTDIPRIQEVNKYIEMLKSQPENAN